MSDTLALKYRPSKWDEVVGQEGVVKSLRSVIKKKSNRTFLLTGGSGTGKTTLARVAALSLGVKLKPTDEMNAALFTGVDDMRDLLSNIHYLPLGGGQRVIILDECHMLSRNAWNSLLKILEEPPEWVWWFLCTTDPEKVPATIKTRSSCYHLRDVSRDTLEEHLTWIAEQEGIELCGGEEEQEIVLGLCAKAARGSVRAAINNLSAVAEAEDKEHARKLLQLVGQAEIVKAHDLAKALLGKTTWPIVKELLQGLKSENPESVRQVVRAYVTAVLMGDKSKSRPETCLAVLDAFSKPFYQGDGITPLVLACGALLFAGE